MGVRKNIYDDKHYCVDCRDFRPLSEFTTPPSGYVASRCKIHKAAYWKEYYTKHSEDRKAYNKGYRWERKMSVLTAYGGKCVDCGIDNPLVLEVHHQDRQQAKEDRKGGYNAYYARLIEENFPPGHEVLCKNCHHLRHLEKPRLV